MTNLTHLPDDNVQPPKIISNPWFDFVVKLIGFAVVPWAIWATANIFGFQAFANRGDHCTDVEMLELAQALRSEMSEETRSVERLLYAIEKDALATFVRKDEILQRGYLHVEKAVNGN